MERIVYTCDVCGVERKEANHWQKALLIEPDPRSQFRIVSFGPWKWEPFNWDTGTLHKGNVVHLCGQACSQKFLDEFLSK